MLQENKINYYSDKFLQSEESSNRALIIQAYSRPPSDSFTNIMNFSTGELVFNSNFKNINQNLIPFNLIEVTSRLKVLVILKEDLPLSLFLRKLL
jgi:hypothetical protein